MYRICCRIYRLVRRIWRGPLGSVLNFLNSKETCISSNARNGSIACTIMLWLYTCIRTQNPIRDSITMALFVTQEGPFQILERLYSHLTVRTRVRNVTLEFRLNNVGVLDFSTNLVKSYSRARLNSPGISPERQFTSPSHAALTFCVFMMDPLPHPPITTRYLLIYALPLSENTAPIELISVLTS